jgi:hypothetical protein
MSAERPHPNATNGIKNGSPLDDRESFRGWSRLKV